MKIITLVLFLAGSAPALAATATPPPAPIQPTCGKTAEECQKQVDMLTDQLAKITLAYQAVRNQRINAQSAKDDADVNAYVQQQAAVAASPPKK